MKKYDVVLFDLDGTLTDSKPGILRCIKMALDKYNLNYTQETLDKMVGPPFRVSMREFFGIDDTETVEDMIKIYRAEYQVRGWKESSVYDGITDLLDLLDREGIRIALATSKPIKFTQIIMDGFGLSRYFECIGGASSDSSRESKADVINYVLSSLNISDKSRVVMVGDRLYDIEGAKTCGLDSIGVLWGYGDRNELAEHGATYILDNPQSVGGFLTK